MENYDKLLNFVINYKNCSMKLNMKKKGSLKINQEIEETFSLQSFTVNKEAIPNNEDENKIVHITRQPSEVGYGEKITPNNTKLQLKENNSTDGLMSSRDASKNMINLNNFISRDNPVQIEMSSSQWSHNKRHEKIEEQDEDEITNEFLQSVRANAEVSQARGKMYDIFLSRDDASVNFNASYFFKFLFYHIMFFFFLGPLFGLILVPIEGYYMVRNMAFLGTSMGAIIQYVQYLAAGPNIFLVVYFKYYHVYEGKVGGMLENFEVSEMIFCVLAIFIRILIISFRYGYTSESGMKVRYLPEIPTVNREYIITGWREVDIRTIDVEVYHSIIRQQIDVELFNLNFFTYLQKGWIERLSNDNFHDDKNSEQIASMYYLKDLIGQEKQIKNHTSKKTINKEEYSKLIPFLKSIRREKKMTTQKMKMIKTILRNSISEKKVIPEEVKENIDAIQDIIDQPDIKIEKSDENLNKKIHETRKTDGYKKLIKRMSMKMKTTTHFISKSSLYGVEEKSLPFYFRKPSVKVIGIDFPGRILMREMVLFSKLLSKKYFMNILSVMIILHSFIPLYYRWANGKSVFGNTGLETFLIIISLLSSIVIFYFSVMFIEIGGNDYARREFCLKSLSAMITPDKYLVEDTLKPFPTILFFSHKNLKSWLLLRILAMDTGLRYIKRTELYASCFLFCYLCIVATLLLGNFGVLKDFNFTNYPVFFLMGYTETIIIVIVLYRMMLIGVRLNEFYDTHKCELTYMKSNFKNILLNFDVWKDMITYVNQYLQAAKEFYLLCQEIHAKKDKDEEEIYLCKKQCVPKNDEEFKNLLETVVGVLDHTIERLELEKEMKPVRLLGIKLTSELLGQFYFGILTLLFSLVQYVITNTAGSTQK